MRGRTSSLRPTGATTWWLLGEEPAHWGSQALHRPADICIAFVLTPAWVNTDPGFLGPRTQTRPRPRPLVAAAHRLRQHHGLRWQCCSSLFPALSLFHLFTTYLLASWRHPPSDGWVRPNVSTLPRFFFNLKTNHTVLWDRTGLYVYGVGVSQHGHFGGQRHFQLCSLLPHTCANEV